VLIYSIMGLYEEAVDLSLKIDIDLAKENADKPEDDEALRKKLWLKIARHVVEEEKDIKKYEDLFFSFFFSLLLLCVRKYSPTSSSSL
jgi:hypothetical protein